MDKTTKSPQQKNTPTPSAHDDAQVSSAQNNRQTSLAKGAVSFAGLLWFVLFASLLLRLFKEYSSFGSGVWAGLGIGILAIGMFLHAKHVLALSFSKKSPTVLPRWQAIYTHVLFGMGTFNLETKSKSEWISPWIATCVPLVFIIAWGLWYLRREVNWVSSLSIVLVVLVYFFSFSFLWAKDSEKSKEKKKNPIIAIFSDKNARDIIQTIGALVGIFAAIVPPSIFIIGSWINNIAPTPIPIYTPTMTQTTMLIVEPIATPETPTPYPTTTMTDTPTITASVTPTITPSIIVQATILRNLREGPSVNHPFKDCIDRATIGVENVIVLGRNLDSTWFFIKVISSGCEGWLHRDWLDSKGLSGIPTASSIPTDFPAPPPIKGLGPKTPTPICDPMDPNC